MPHLNKFGSKNSIPLTHDGIPYQIMSSTRGRIRKKKHEAKQNSCVSEPLSILNTLHSAAGNEPDTPAYSAVPLHPATDGYTRLYSAGKYKN